MQPPALPVSPGATPEPAWSIFIPDEQWSVLEVGTDAIERACVQCVFAGGLALAMYTAVAGDTPKTSI